MTYLDQPTPQALCIGKTKLFDSTDPRDHDQATKLCAACQLQEWCSAKAVQLNQAPRIGHHMQLNGTWGGRLYGARVNDPHRVATEDAMFTDDEARLAHRAWNKGDHSDRSRIGERVYQRRAAARLRAKRAA